MENADFIIAIFDGSEPLNEYDIELLEKIKDKSAVITINKSDLPVRISPDDFQKSMKQYLHISAVTGEGLEDLKSIIFNSNIKNWKEDREGIVVTNLRHKLALDNTASALERSIDVLSGDQPLELFSIEIRDALDSIGEITGTVTTEDILDKIFNDFCIGK